MRALKTPPKSSQSLTSYGNRAPRTDWVEVRLISSTEESPAQLMVEEPRAASSEDLHLPDKTADQDKESSLALMAADGRPQETPAAVLKGLVSLSIRGGAVGPSLSTSFTNCW